MMRWVKLGVACVLSAIARWALDATVTEALLVFITFRIWFDLP